MNNEKINRRDFLKELGFVAGTTALLSSFPWLSGMAEDKRKATTGHKARIAVIGTGDRGRYLLNFLVMNPKAEVVWLCDNYEPWLELGRQIAPSAKTCADYRQVIDDPNKGQVQIRRP